MTFEAGLDRAGMTKTKRRQSPCRIGGVHDSN
jgi:hypothetical protein